MLVFTLKDQNLCNWNMYILQSLDKENAKYVLILQQQFIHEGEQTSAHLI